MGLAHEIKHNLNFIKFSIKNIFKRKEPVYIPVYEGQLLKGKVALITGGTSGIGYSIAKLYLENGCNVIITGRSKEKIERAIKKLEDITRNSQIFGLELDLERIETFEKILEDASNMTESKKIDILVNNAGMMINDKFGSTTIENFDNIINSNLRGLYFLTQTYINKMIKCKYNGSVINISSSSDNRPATNPYSVTKWGIKGLTIGLAKKYVDYGIRVNSIAPGPTLTKMLNKEINERDISKSQYPLDRYIMPEEIANVAVFLASDMGKMIVGQTIYVSGGLGIITVDDINY